MKFKSITIKHFRNFKDVTVNIDNKNISNFPAPPFSKRNHTVTKNFLDFMLK